MERCTLYYYREVVESESVMGLKHGSGNDICIDFFPRNIKELLKLIFRVGHKSLTTLCKSQSMRNNPDKNVR
jgi:hypothetical protein